MEFSKPELEWRNLSLFQEVSALQANPLPAEAQKSPNQVFHKPQDDY